MAQKSSKAQKGAVTSLDMRLDGGVNYSLAPGEIGDNEAVLLSNYMYDPQTATPLVRPATRCKTAATCDGTNAIIKLYVYEKTSTGDSWLLAVCNGNLYYLSGASLNAWTLIGALADATTIPSFLTYHSKLLIADGGQHIKTWDGTTYGSLDDGLYANALATIKGRVVANSTASGSKDLVTMTGSEDETAWNTATEGAIALRAGYGDNMNVIGFSVFGNDLIVAKKGDTHKRLYRINVADATASNWYVRLLSNNNGPQNAHTMIQAYDNVFFVDTNGFKSLVGIEQYGDLATDYVGQNINTLFNDSATTTELAFIPFYQSLMFCVNDRVFNYQKIPDGQGGVKGVFTDMVFNQGRIRSIVQWGSSIYLAGNSGYLYYLDTTDTYSTDETAPSTTSVYSSKLRTKQYLFFGDGILRKTQIYLRPIRSGTAYLYSLDKNLNTTTLKTLTLLNGNLLLYNATGYLADATEYLYDADNTPYTEETRNRVRGETLQFQLSLSSGRVGVERIRAEVALVEGQ